ncbi:Transmembrane protein [Toxocara canis]|uniref:Transmembrane protein n=1 Tax=Toxocara canis TaxID=6265 RepID=A0A0B2VW40_TOXCA|nr:Transmembrane protein [Toxocara canis]
MNDTAVGFICCIVSCIAFGVMFTPLRKFDSGDGFFVQWVECSVVFVIGFGVNVVRNFPPFQPIAIIGGLLFTTGNVAAVPLINGLGMGPGMLLWGSMQVIAGWCAGRFGLFHTKPQLVYNPTMNISGLVLVLISGVMFMFVAHESQEEVHLDVPKLDGKVFSIKNIRVNYRMSGKKFFYAGLAIFIGVFHGFMMTPITYIIENVPGASPNVLDYIFAHYSSIFAFSTIYYFAYCLYKRNQPHAPANLVLPSAIYGFLWSTGMILFFISNRLLSQVVSFPITTRLPSTIGVLTDVFIFKTIKGVKNLTFLAFAITVGLTGDVLLALSNQKL